MLAFSHVIYTYIFRISEATVPHMEKKIAVAFCVHTSLQKIKKKILDKIGRTKKKKKNQFLDLAGGVPFYVILMLWLRKV